MSLETPTVGASRGTWGTTMNSNLTKIDGHNHSGGTGGQIPTSGININADLSFGSLYGPKDLHAITFASIVTPGGSYNKSLFVSDGTGGLTLNELYWKNNAGNSVKITDGNSLNVAAFVGGITGDYTAVSAAEAFDNSSKNYTFKDGSAHWAGLRAGSLVLSEKGTSGSSTITLTVPTGLASTYAMTLPSALPANDRPVSVNASGVMSFGATKTLVLSGFAINSSAFNGYTSSPPSWAPAGATDGVLAIPLNTGDTITSITFAVFGDGAADLSAVDVIKCTSAGVDTSIGSTSVTNPAASWNDTTINVTDTLLAAGDTVSMTFTASATAVKVGNIRISYF